MIYILSLILIALIVVIFLQYRAQKDRSGHLQYIHHKLDQIISEETQERLLVFTDDLELKRLLIDVNRLLDYNHKVMVDRMKMEKSMRKMLSNISHDLKTPLTVVLGNIETIIHDNRISPEDRNKLLGKVHSKANEVIQMMNTFFDLAKLESGDQHIPLTRVNIGEVCRRNMLAFYDLLTSNGLEVQIDIPDKSLFVMANEEALDRILNNLISNAIRYGSDGNVVGLSLRHDDGLIHIDVWDQGKGITELHQDKVFERMYTLEDSRNKLYQGSGLGLTITKRLVEQLNGTISLSSVPFVRTAFTIQLRRMQF